MPGIVCSVPLPTPTMSPVQLLLVEDDPVSRGFLTQALERFPARVDVAVDAVQAVAFANRAAHALWLLDANLPDASGEELLQQLRAINPATPALCLTAEVDGGRLAALKRAGFAEVLQKPIVVGALHAAVRRQLGLESQATASTGEQSPAWDDTQALRALGGNLAAVQALRGLFIAELPLQADTIARAIVAGNTDAIRAELHRLKAGCGFVGNARVLIAVHALHAAPLDPMQAARFNAAVQEALASSDDASQPTGSI